MTQPNVIHNTSEPYCIESSMEETEKINRESREESPVLIRKNVNSMKTSVISESSDSEKNEKSIKKCLRLNRKLNKTLIEKDKKMQTYVLESNDYVECNNEYFTSNSVTLLNKNKEKLETLPRNMKNKHLQSPQKNINNKQQKNNIISDSDTEDSQSKYNYKELSRMKWTGPDIKLNLKDLGLNEQLGSWIEFTQEKPVMSTIPVSYYQFNN